MTFPAPAVTMWDTAERRYAADGYHGAAPADSVRTVPGSGVIVTAPHAVTHVREGKVKFADCATGGLADVLAATVGVTAVTCAGVPARDPNHDLDGTFKSALAPLLACASAVVDLHGMRDVHGVDVCLGLGPRPHLATPLAVALRDAFTRHGMTVSVDAPFNARKPGTVTAFCQRRDVPAVQVELARRLRDPDTNPAVAAAVVAALTEAVASLRVAVPVA